MDARVHLGEGAPVVRLRWMFTDQPFLPIDSQCVIMNRIWDQDQVSELSVGQLPVLQSRYKQDARWVLTPLVIAGHMCHPEWLSTGEPWPVPSTLPPVVVGPPYWIPACCPQRVFACNDFATVFFGQTSLPPYSIGGFGYGVVGTGSGLFCLAGAVSTAIRTDGILATITSGAPIGVRVSVYVTDSGGATIAGSVRVRLSDGTDDTFSTSGPTVREYFTSTVITTVDVRAIQVPGPDSFPTMDLLCFA